MRPCRRSPLSSQGRRREWASMKWTKTFLPRRHKSPSPACPFCWAGSFAFDGALQDVRIAAKNSNRFCGVRIERGKRDEGAPDAALSGALCVFCCVEFAGSREKLLFCHAGKTKTRRSRWSGKSPRLSRMHRPPIPPALCNMLPHCRLQRGPLDAPPSGACLPLQQAPVR